MLDSTNFLGVKISTNSEDEILKYLLSKLDKPKSKRGKIVIFTPNPEQIMASRNHPELATLLNKADIALPDGVGVVRGAKLLGVPIKHRITGVDFMVKLASAVSNRPVKSGFFGGLEGVAERCANCLQKSYQNFTIGYASDTYDKQEMDKSDIDILFVGLGFPKQERWIIEHKDEIPANIIMAVGGSFDFLSGRVIRAPKLVRDIGFEWFFRLIRQPWRVGRQARLLNFSALIFVEALTSRLKSPKK